MELTDQQQAVVDNRGGAVLVSAAAGSGKTRVLVERLLGRVEREGANLDDFLIITYTKAAAAELRGKIIDELNLRIARHPEDHHLRRQSVLVYRANISTIHAFCSAVLREFGHLLALDPDFRVAEENICAALKEKALDQLLEERYETLAPDFAALVDTMSAGRDDSRLRRIVLDIHGRIQSHPAPRQWLEAQADAFEAEGITDAGQTVWGALLLEDTARQIRYWRGALVRGLELLRGDPALEAAYAASFDDLLDSLDDLLAALGQGWDAARRKSDITYTALKGSRKITDKAAQEQAKALWNRAKKQLSRLTARFVSESSALLDDLRAVAPAVRALMELTADFGDAYQQEKSRRHLLDFSDLEHLTLELLTTQETAAAQLQGRFWEILVDEYQDTNSVQNAIFDALSRNGRNLCFVGDVKQSIYRFRLADPSIFIEKYRSFPPFTRAAEGEGRTIVLSRNFRSRPSVLAGVNFVFEHLMTAELGEIDYTEDQRLNPGFPYPPHPNDRVELDIVEPPPAPEDGSGAAPTVAQTEAAFLARRIRELLEEGFPVTQGGQLRPARPEDICILSRSIRPILPSLTAALDRAGIPWQAQGEDSFWETMEVRTALAFLEIIDNPRQDIPLLAVLRSPVGGFSNDRLALLRAACPCGDIYTVLTAGGERGEADCGEFLSLLTQLRRLAADTPGHRLLQIIYRRTAMSAIFGAMPGGETRQANLQLLYDYVCRLEQSGHQGVFSLVNHFRRLRDSGERLAGRESGGSGVKIMSIHRSKGLEFPIVLLAGLTRKFNQSDQTAPVLFHSKLGVGPKGIDRERGVVYTTLARSAVAVQLDREMRSEELRLLYVAMTRAREKLILICTFKDWEKAREGLLADSGPHPSPQALAALPTVGHWLLLPVLARTDAAPLRQGASPQGDWLTDDFPWDIRRVHLDSLETVERDAPAEAPASARPGLKPEERREVLDFLAWEYPYRAAENLPSKLTATQLKGRRLDAETAEDAPPPALPLEFRLPDFMAGEQPLTAAQRGTAVHAVIERIDLRKADTVTGVSEEIARLVSRGWLTEQQGRAVDPGSIAAFFGSPLGRAAAAAGDLQREFKFSLLVSARSFSPQAPEGDEVLLQGVIDCCFSTAEGLTVVDFKTDRVSCGGEADRAEEYRAQLDVYTRALEEITGKTVVRRVIWFLRTGCGVEL